MFVIVLILLLSGQVAVGASGGPKFKVSLLDNKEITINISMKNNKAVLYLMGNHMFGMTAKYLPISGSTPDNLIELKGDGFRKIHLNRSRKILYFREGTKGTFAQVSID